MPTNAMENKGSPIYNVSPPRWVVNRINHQIETGSKGLSQIANEAILAYLRDGKPEVPSGKPDGHFKGRVFLAEKTIVAMGELEPGCQVTSENRNPPIMAAGRRVAHEILLKALTYHAQGLPEVIHKPVLDAHYPDEFDAVFRAAKRIVGRTLGFGTAT